MIGEQIGNYVVRQQLGEGGMGTVYLAEHPQIGKRVALKVLHPELASNQDITTRFFHEAKAVNDIGHPNIVDILDFGSTNTERGPLVYLVMELLSGSTLTSAIEQGAMDPRRTLRIAHQVADALAASHAKGIVHRDLKPDNIMLVTRGREEQVKLLDFGIAKMTGTTSTKTRTGMVMGTPAYMSPEQCEGRGDIDHRTDIYALGIVLYQMLTGRLPFDGSGYGEILVKQITEAPVPLSTVRPNISPHLEQIVLKALQKRPEQRFATMHELAAALAQSELYVDTHGGRQGFLPASPITSAPPTASTVMLDITPPIKTNPTTLSYSASQVTGSETAARPGRSKALLATGGIAVVALAVGIGFFAVNTRGSSRAAIEPTTVELAPGSAAAPRTAVAPTVPPAPAPGPATAPVSAPPAARATVRLTIETTPIGAAVFIDGESKPHCTSPCDVEVQHSSKDTHVTVKLAGFKDEQRTIRPDADQRVALELEKKLAPTHHTSTPAKPLTQPIGDNTLNPFDN